MKLKYAVYINQTRATFTQLKSVASAATLNRILMEAEEGNFIYFAKYFDTFYLRDGSGASDGAVLDFFKTLTDEAGVAENATNQFMKALQHTAGATDGIDTIDFGKNFEHVSAVSESYARHFGKPLTDGFSVADDAAKLHPNKITFDTTGAADEINTFAVGLNKADPTYFAEEHFFAMGKPLEDEFSLGETHFVAVSKPLFDDVYGAEDHVFIFTKKAKEDEFTTSDTLAWDFGKPLSDSYSLSDAYSLEPGKVLYDLVAGVGDQAFVFTKKVKEDTSSAADAINTKGFGKALVDVSSFAEQHRYDFGKPLSDDSLVLEAHSLEPGKVLTDVVTGIGDYVFLYTKKAPDNPVGAADAIDTVDVGKTLQNLAATTDVVDTVDVGKALTDTSAATDAVNTVGTTKLLTDSVFATDDIDGAASILDDQEMQFMKQRTDVVGFSDHFIIYKSYLRDFLDAMAAQDKATYSYGKSLSDASSASDSTNVVTGKQIYDIPVASETLAFALSRVRSDSALLGDAQEVAVGKSLLDLASTADAGSLRSQGYSEFTFFAEDFVGASRTF